ncbi:MAG TPA: hypothetical protein VN664_08960 [Burkholderiales bacterium]|nr:hypothetical protein [Burkholderiales bacterium]
MLHLLDLCTRLLLSAKWSLFNYVAREDLSPSGDYAAAYLLRRIARRRR